MRREQADWCRSCSAHSRRVFVVLSCLDCGQQIVDTVETQTSTICKLSLNGMNPRDCCLAQFVSLRAILRFTHDDVPRLVVRNDMHRPFSQLPVNGTDPTSLDHSGSDRIHSPLLLPFWYLKEC